MQCPLKMIINMWASEHCALSALLTTHPHPDFFAGFFTIFRPFQPFNNFLGKKIGVGLSFNCRSLNLLFFKFVCSLPNFKMITLK